MNAIGTKWVFRNKKDELSIIKSKARLVVKAYNQEERFTLMKFIHM